jgi:hypothetical protein
MMGIGYEVTTLREMLITPGTLTALPTNRFLTSHKDRENACLASI